MSSNNERVRLSRCDYHLRSRNIEETSELRARLEILERLLGDHVPNFFNLTGFDRSNSNQGPLPLGNPRAQPRTIPSPDLPSHRRPQDAKNRELPGAVVESEGALAAFAEGQSLGERSAHPAFDMSSMLDQPLVFDFQTSPFGQMKQAAAGQASEFCVPIRMEHALPPQDPGHGTLVMSTSGSSKWLGHTAASEWLKDVSQ